MYKAGDTHDKALVIFTFFSNSNFYLANSFISLCILQDRDVYMTI